MWKYFSWIVIVLALIKHITRGIPTSQNTTDCRNFSCTNGRCKSDGLSCVCQVGFKGTTCNEDFDECSLGNPCSHRGHCHNSFGTYRCECLEGWTGETDHCRFKDNSAVHRRCTQGWMGEMCQDQCLNNSMCRNSGICEKKRWGHHCACEPGWHGIICSDDIDECTSIRCSAKEYCINTPGSFKCRCIQGWTGTSCDVDVDECKSSQCLHSGTCENTLGSYRCHCDTGWSGLNCEMDINECENSPCNITSICINSPGSFVCHIVQRSSIEMSIIRRTYTIVGIAIVSLLFGCSIAVCIGVIKYKCRGVHGKAVVKDVISVQTPNRGEVNSQRYRHTERHEHFSRREYYLKQEQNLQLHVHLHQSQQNKKKQSRMNKRSVTCHIIIFNTSKLQSRKNVNINCFLTNEKNCK